MKKVFAAILTLLLLGVSFSSASGYMTLEQELEIAKNNYRSSKSKLAAEKSRLNVLRGDYASNAEQLNAVSKEINSVEFELERLKTEIERTEKSILNTREELNNIGVNIDKKRDQVSGLLRFVNEISDIRFIDFVFSATDFSEISSRNSTINQILDSVVDATNSLKEETAGLYIKQSNLEFEEIRLSDLKEKRDAEKKSLDSLYSKHTQLQNSINNEIATSDSRRKYYENLEKQYTDEMNSIFKAIEERNRRLRMDGPFIWPVGGYVTSPYGMRVHPISGVWAMHYGVDIWEPEINGKPIYASADGVVELAQWWYGYGNCVIISHGYNAKYGATFGTLYGHLSRYNTQKGATVKKGDVIGFIGTTGRSTGPHLHYEIRVNGSAQDPMKYLPQK